MRRAGMCVAMVCAVLVGGWFSAAGAQGATGSGQATMGEVVVTASREKEAVNRVPANVTVITAESIAKSTAQNVPELLSMEGLQVTDVIGNRRTYWVDLRGFGESAPANLLVLVDGRRINQPDLTHSDWTLIPMERIERIEVIRGGRGSVLYGDNASAGVINIITKEAGRNGANIDVKYGSYDTFNQSVSVSAAEEQWSATMFGSFFKTNGYRDNSDVEARDFGLNSTFYPWEKVRLHFSGGLHTSENGLPGSLFQSDLDGGMSRRATKTPDNFNEVEDSYAKAGMELDILTGDSFILDGSFRRRKNVFASEFPGLGLLESETETDTFTVSPQMVFREDFGTVKNRLSFGYDYTHSRQDIPDAFKMRRTNHSFYIFDDLEVAEGLSFSGGYRRDKARYEFDPSDPESAKHKESAYTTGINYAYKSASHIYASYAKSYRYPLLDEIYLFTDTDSINTGLKPQTSDHYEAGVTHQLNTIATVSLNFFHIRTSNEIFWDPLVVPFGQNANMEGKTIRQGAELGAGFRYSNIYLYTNYTFTEAEFDGGPFDGNEVPNVPRHTASANIGYQFSFGTSLNVSGTYVGKRPFISDFDNVREDQESYTVVNAGIRHPWRSALFYLNLNNIFDEKYSAFGGVSSTGVLGYFPSPGFNVLGGVMLRFGGI